jgi:hypothetical protein
MPVLGRFPERRIDDELGDGGAPCFLIFISRLDKSAFMGYSVDGGFAVASALHCLFFFIRSHSQISVEDHQCTPYSTPQIPHCRRRPERLYGAIS